MPQGLRDGLLGVASPVSASGAVVLLQRVIAEVLHIGDDWLLLKQVLFLVKHHAIVNPMKCCESRSA